jgi:hypothetical protein
MPRLIRAALLFGTALLLTVPVEAQDPVPPPVLEEPIERFVFDARGVLARFKGNSAIADALGVEATDLPTRGLGLVVGAHLYPLRTRTFALGLGGEVMLRARASRTLPPAVENGPDGPTIVTSMTAFSPQMSLNFGRRNGWSYLTGGIGRASFTSELEDDPFDDPESRPTAINYGGGARWFTNKHLAFTVDLRFYSIRPQEPVVDRPGFPRMTVMVFSAGISAR